MSQFLKKISPYTHTHTHTYIYVVVVQSPSHVWLFATPWTAAHQASQSFTISQSLPKSMSIGWWCHPAISSVALFSFCLQSCWASGSLYRGFPGCKEHAHQYRRYKRCRFDPWVGKIPLKEAMGTHSSILGWRIPHTEESSGLQRVAKSQKQLKQLSRHTCICKHTQTHIYTHVHTHTYTCTYIYTHVQILHIHLCIYTYTV